MPSLSSRPRTRSLEKASDVRPPKTTPPSTAGLAPAPIGENGLAKKAAAIDPVTVRPAEIKCVRRARPEDAEAIVRIQECYELRKIDAADHPKNGWLFQKSAPEAIRFAMEHYKDFWVAEDAAGKIIAFQAVSAARFISRPASKHKFFGRYAKRARDVLASGKFIYMSQIATDPAHRGKGLAASFQKEVLRHYKNYPLVAHVAVFTQSDFDAWDKNPATFEPRTNNVVSHRYHQKHGYVPVAWTSDIAGTVAYNSGVPRADSNDGPPPVLGVLYVHFRDGEPAVPREYTDPLKAVLDSPCAAGECDSEEWINPFSPYWPEREPDRVLDDLLCGSFLPLMTSAMHHVDRKQRAELDELRLR